TAAQYGELLADYAAHEAGHLLGLVHAHTVNAGEDPLAEVAWKPYTHVETAKDVRADLLDDGQLTIAGHEYDVHPKVFEAIRDYEAFYYAGTVGPDGFPDLVMGLGVIHATDTATWLTRILDMAWAAQTDSSFTTAEKSQILAWSYGFLTHAAGDHWAHTLVNEFAEGVFPAVGEVVSSISTEQRELANALRHNLVEGYIGDATLGFDNNPDRTVLPDGDVSDDSTPGIPFDAPIRFIYETLIRPFPFDPSPLVQMGLKNDETLSVDASGAMDAFVRSGNVDGSFVENGFKAGQKITVSGFSNPANNGTFFIESVTASRLTVTANTLVDETSSGDEKIVVGVPYNEPTTINVDAATDSFVRTSGSFKDDGFVAGQRFTVYGFNDYHGDYLVDSISPDGLTLTVKQDLDAGNETGSGDEQLVAQGKRGELLNGIFTLRDAIETAAIIAGPRIELGTEVGDLLDQITQGTLPDLSTLTDLYRAYLYNWVDEINEGLAHWPELGLAVTKALLDPQSRRDLQNEEGASEGPDTLGNTLRADAEASVGIIDVLFEELDDPNGDDSTTDSFINKHLLPMFGLPEELGVLRAGLQAFSSLVGDLLAPITAVFNPIEAAINEVKDFVTDFIKGQIEKVFGFSFEVFEFLTDLSSKMDLATIEVGGTAIPVFKPGDHERLDAFLGITPQDHHNALPVAFANPVTIAGVTFTFYADVEGTLTDAAEFNKTTFAAYANTVTLAKMLLLQENPVDGATTGANQLSALFSDVRADLSLSPSAYEFALLNLNGAHGGNILTTTLPGVPGTEGRPWLVSIDSDHVWRADSMTTTTALFRVSTVNTGTPSPAVWETTITPGEYRIYATWQANVTQTVDNLGNSTHPDQHLLPATNAQYTVKDGATAFATQPDAVNQRRFAGDPEFPGGVEDEDGGLAFRLLGTFVFLGDTLRVELSNIANGNVIAGPIRIEPTGGGTPRRIQNNRDPETLDPTLPDEYTDGDSAWTDFVYDTGTGNNPLWESQILRPVFRHLFADWQNGVLDFPALGDATSADPNTAPIAKTELPSHATPFGPAVADSDIEVPIPDALRDVILDGLDGLVGLIED
ncbi:MAG TPA: hypothetical protein VIK60_03730, partial [Vicinamibacterales bacterium]